MSWDILGQGWAPFSWQGEGWAVVHLLTVARSLFFPCFLRVGLRAGFDELGGLF